MISSTDDNDSTTTKAGDLELMTSTGREATPTDTITVWNYSVALNKRVSLSERVVFRCTTSSTIEQTNLLFVVLDIKRKDVMTELDKKIVRTECTDWYNIMDTNVVSEAPGTAVPGPSLCG
jgi:hypothetical protein